MTNSNIGTIDTKKQQASSVVKVIINKKKLIDIKKHRTDINDYNNKVDRVLKPKFKFWKNENI